MQYVFNIICCVLRTTFYIKFIIEINAFITTISLQFVRYLIVFFWKKHIFTCLTETWVQNPNRKLKFHLFATSNIVPAILVKCIRILLTRCKWDLRCVRAFSGVSRYRSPTKWIEGLGIGLKQTICFLQFGEQCQFGTWCVIVITRRTFEPHCCRRHCCVAASIRFDY